MPVVVASASRSADALISYALDGKPDQKGERYVMASGVGGLLVSVAKQQMRDVRKKWNKNKPGAFVHAYHVIESFAKDELDPDDPDAWMTAQNLGRALAEDRFPGRQALIVTQRDGKSGCVHNHIVVNSIDTKTGRSLDSSIVMHSRLVEAHERVLEAEGFEQRADLMQAFADATDRRDRGEPSTLRRADSTQRSELREFQRYILWEADNDIADEFGAAHKPEPFSVTVLKGCIKRALADQAATDWNTLTDAGRRHGVLIEQRGKKGRGISYGMLREQPDGTKAEPSASDRRRCSSLGTDFEMDAVEHALAHNIAAQQAQAVLTPVAATQFIPSATQKKPEQGKPSIEERLRLALDEVNAEADVNTQHMIADYMTAKAAQAEPQKPSEAPFQVEAISEDGAPDPDEAPDQFERTANATASGRGSVSAQPVAEETRELSEAAPETTEETEPAETISKAQAAEQEADKLRRFNERNRRLGLPVVSPEQHATNQTLTPEQRRLRLAHPELFDDATPATKPRKPDRVLGD
jgi:hypothetical protein